MTAKEKTPMSLLLPCAGDADGFWSDVAGASQGCAINHDQFKPSESLACGSFSHKSTYTVLVYLENYGGHEMWCDAKPVALPFQQEGWIGIYDRAYCWKHVLSRPLNCVQFHFPKLRLELLAGCAEGMGLELLHDQPFELSLADPLLKYLALASIPLLNSPDQTSVGPLEQVMDAVIVHTARTYARARCKATYDRDRLAPWQIRRIDEIISTKIEGKVTVDELASACALSPSHFSFLFKNTKGHTPHQWLMNQRIAFAQRLLTSTNDSLADIACASGFSDQSHFTRVFSRRMHASPSAWRREGIARSSDASSSIAGNLALAQR